MTSLNEADVLQERVAEEVRAQMARRRISARQVAQTLDWSPMYLSRRLSGQIAFTITDLHRLARLLRTSITAFLPDEARYNETLAVAA